MTRVEPIERALPSDWKRVIRDQPLLSVCAALAAGIYLGKHHGRQLLSAAVSLALTTAIEGAKQRFGR
ncbi:MAG: hypothetical protein M3R62_08050 [Acidobacteriota bacterium]|nr:hypothetical protein [Acidobacteriota bacterium]